MKIQEIMDKIIYPYNAVLTTRCVVLALSLGKYILPIPIPDYKESK